MRSGGISPRSFSPVFHVDAPRRNPARIVYNPEAELNMGGLVNNPAFKNNLPLWAKDAGPSSRSKTTTASSSMKKTQAELEAQIQQIEKDLTELDDFSLRRKNFLNDTITRSVNLIHDLHRLDDAKSRTF